jgi:acyl-coenzyme A thioesterase PaaI-like protein
MFADVAEEIEEADGGSPVGVVDDAGRVAGRTKVEQALELGLNAREIVGELLAGEQVAFGGFAAGVADHAGGAAGEADRVVTRELEAPQGQLRDKMPDVEGIAGRVEAAIQRDRPLA